MIHEHEDWGNLQPTDPEHRFIRTYNRGDIIFEEGSRGKEMYVVYTGKVEISKKDAMGKENPLGHGHSHLRRHQAGGSGPDAFQVLAAA